MLNFEHSDKENMAKHGYIIVYCIFIYAFLSQHGACCMLLFQHLDKKNMAKHDYTLLIASLF